MQETIRLAGAILIAGCGAATGFMAGRRLRDRVRSLEQLVFALETMLNEISFSRTPLPEIIQKLSLCGQTPVCRLFGDISERLAQNPHDGLRPAFRLAIRGYKEQASLENEEIETLEDLSLTLGRYDVEGEQRALRLALRRLERSLADARERQVRDGRLCKTLGIGSGLIAAIILL